MNALNSVRLERERCLAIVDAEEGFNGGMPDELFELISYRCDREYLEEVFRAIVRITKRNIRDKINQETI